VTSHRPPHGPCYVCTSPLHYARDCPLFGKWETLRKALIIQVDVDQSIIDVHDQQYLGGLYSPPGVPSKSAQNDMESVWIHMDSKQKVEPNFTCVLASPVHMDLHRFRVVFTQTLGVHSDNSE
jgi:hypothetical protein